MRKLSTICAVITVAVALTAPSALSDAQAINFSCIMQYSHDRFYALAGLTMFNPETSDWTAEGGLGILDVNEFELLSLILADPSAPNHDAIHAAFAQNAAAARAALGSTIVGLTTSNNTSGPTERQPIPGTDPQAYYGADGLFGAYLTMGEWVWYDTCMCGLANSFIEFYWTPGGIYWGKVPGENEEYRVNYDLTNMPYLSAFGDADGDTKTNIEEWDEVMAAGGGIDTWLDAATDPDNFWAGNPDMPVAGILGLALLAGSMLAGAALAICKN